MNKTFHLTLRPDRIAFFSPLFQQGIIIKTLVGTSIKDFLVEGLGINLDYVETRIQTVFLNGKAVDDLENSAIKDGATLALSGALPGLVGATFRRGGTYASFRKAITLQEGKESIPLEEGRIVLKLFNLIVPELTPLLLARGVWITGAALDRFLTGLPQSFWEGCPEVGRNGQETEMVSRSALGDLHRDELILFKVTQVPF